MIWARIWETNNFKGPAKRNFFFFKLAKAICVTVRGRNSKNSEDILQKENEIV